MDSVDKHCRLRIQLSNAAMIAFLTQRILQSIAVLLAVSAVAFTLFRFAGDPVNMMVAEDDTAQRRTEVRQSISRSRSNMRASSSTRRMASLAVPTGVSSRLLTCWRSACR
jgi:ABC-type microcin C transport system permease subunit YejB